MNIVELNDLIIGDLVKPRHRIDPKVQYRFTSGVSRRVYFIQYISPLRKSANIAMYIGTKNNLAYFFFCNLIHHIDAKNYDFIYEKICNI